MRLSIEKYAMLIMKSGKERRVLRNKIKLRTFGAKKFTNTWEYGKRIPSKNGDERKN